jgi:3',5'-cyclic AMP phosphodiesterase CpdA
MRLAIIADPHVHDPRFDPQGDGRGAFRTIADTVASTRVFNESLPALRQALEQIAAEGIELVVIVGDLTDDGELYARQALLALTNEFTSRHGMRFFATFGNHDLFALDGRHIAKRFARAEGGDVLVGSAPDADIVNAEMFSPGYAATIHSYGTLGFMRQSADLYWESPLGPSDAPEARRYKVVSSDGETSAEMIDGSYLVEPVDGLWLLSIDANVYVPDAARFSDRSDEGWGATVRYKPFLLEWIAGVTARAARLGKQLVAFSHYPIAGPYAGEAPDEARVFGTSRQARRPVVPEVSRMLHDVGLRTHFSGHWHVAGIVERYGLINISVPSLVAYPPAYQLLDIAPDGTMLQTVRLDEAPGYDLARTSYGSGPDAQVLTAASSYVDFLDRHLGLLVRNRYVPLEWPDEIASLVLPGFSLIDFAHDWYRLRKGGTLACDLVPRQRLAAYRAIADSLAGKACAPGSAEAVVAAALRLMEACLAAPDLRHYKLNLVLDSATSDATSAAPSGATRVSAPR